MVRTVGAAAPASDRAPPTRWPSINDTLPRRILEVDFESDSAIAIGSEIEIDSELGFGSPIRRRRRPTQ